MKTKGMVTITPPYTNTDNSGCFNPKLLKVTYFSKIFKNIQKLKVNEKDVTIKFRRDTGLKNVKHNKNWISKIILQQGKAGE